MLVIFCPNRAQFNGLFDDYIIFFIKQIFLNLPSHPVFYCLSYKIFFLQVVDFVLSGHIQCSRCKAQINTFMNFIDQGSRFISVLQVSFFHDEVSSLLHQEFGDFAFVFSASLATRGCHYCFSSFNRYFVKSAYPLFYVVQLVSVPFSSKGYFT